MDRLKKIYLGLIFIIIALSFSIIYRTASQTISPSVTTTSKQDILTVGDELAANFKIYNPASEPRSYTYALYVNDTMRYENMVTIGPGRDFTFGGHYRALEPGKIPVNALVWEGEKDLLVENITYYVTISYNE